MIPLHLHRGILPTYKKVLLQESQEPWLEIASTLAIPLTYFLAFGLGLRNYLEQVEGYPYMVFLSPGLISLTILSEAYRTGAWSLWLDRFHQGMTDEYRIKPISTWDIIIGEILGSFTSALVKGGLTAAVLILMGALPLTWQHVPLYLLYMFLGCILFSSVGTIVGSWCAKPHYIANSQVIVITPLLYLGGLFFPLSALPDWLVSIVRWLPTTALFDGSRHALLAGVADAHYLSVLVVCALVGFVVAVWQFNWKLSE